MLRMVTSAGAGCHGHVTFDSTYPWEKVQQVVIESTLETSSLDEPSAKQRSNSSITLLLRVRHQPTSTQTESVLFRAPTRLNSSDSPLTQKRRRVMCLPSLHDIWGKRQNQGSISIRTASLALCGRAEWAQVRRQ